MKTIKNIFFTDIKSLSCNYFALVIALGLCILPALYAWFNIYSNWDPYGNTGNIKIAVASKDKGYTDASGATTNVGEQIMNTLQANDSIDWVITSESKAKEGLYRGDYYAAILLPDNFSECMYTGMLHDLQKPRLTYYVNDKKNAVATKITDTAVTNLENSINEMYISILVRTAFEKENVAASDLLETDTLAQLQNKIDKVSTTLAGYTTTIHQLTTANAKLNSTLEDAGSDLDSIQNFIQKESTNTTDSTSSLSDTLRSKNRTIDTALSNANRNMTKAAKTDKMSTKIKFYQKAVNHLEKVNNELKKIKNALPSTKLSATLDAQNQQLRTKITTQLQTITSLTNQIKSGITDQAATLSDATENAWGQTFDTVNHTFETILMPLMEDMAALTDTLQSDISNTLDSMKEDIELLNQIINGTSTSLDYADQSLTALSNTVQQVSDHLDALNESLDSLSNSELLQKALNFMQGNPEGYGAFFSAPVQMDTERIYPVDNYGSGVTPFYTTLAIWVGGIFLVSLIRVKPDPQKYPDAKPHELFFGRFLLFAVLGQVQTLIIIIGNLALLHTQCLLPKHFWFASALASLTFLLLIYAFTVSFGDIGKALIVVFVVIQIAGSSGTFPIEILPEFYQKIYIFFPFPYAINAMREAICGLNGNDYWIDLMELLLFAIAALLLGLVIRLPFRRVSHFVEKRMEDTEMM